MCRVEAPFSEESIFNWIKLIISDWSGTASMAMIPIWRANVMTIPSLQNVSFEDWQKLAEQSSGIADFLTRAGWRATLEEFREANKENYDAVVQEGIYVPKLREEAAAVFKQLVRMIPLVVVSNHPQENVLKEAENYDIADNFGQIYAGVFDKKEEILGQVCEEMGCTPGQAVYICDSVSDIRAARTAGCLSIAICGGYTSEEILAAENPDYLIKDLSDLFKL